MGWELWINLVVMVLLVATIAYAIMLNRRLSAFKAMQETMQELAANFTQATNTAQQTVTDLKITAENASGQLTLAMDKAKKLKEDLDFMVDRGDVTVKRLEEGIDHARDVVKKVQAIATLKNENPNKVLTVSEDNKKNSEKAKAAPRKARATESVGDDDERAALMETLKALR